MSDFLLYLWFASLFASLAYVIWHNVFHNPVSWVQKLAWILVTAYAGIFGLLAYWFICRTQKGKSHDESTQANWQQGVNSEMHCLAGDATGIIVSAAIVYHFGFPNGVDLIIEYTSAFVVGLFIFQALMMVGMYRGDYLLAVRKTFFVETVSMNMVMLGMIPVMVILMHWLPEGDNPWKLNFWFIMGMATIAGGVTAYPINYWLVRKKIKHGCMTIKPEGEGEMHHTLHEMGSLSLAFQFFGIVITFLLLLAAAYFTTYVAPITFA
ncbi:MAG: DUF4396 domain-containing protein [Chlamydiales bacterium]|nr:DUF4396 domain-containing protein [Chlamydiia bacterium]MCP5507162.1 DUF4396 domain-containing protein [Chlamydiales bacterium]